jgi:hypothetical protein
VDSCEQGNELSGSNKGRKFKKRILNHGVSYAITIFTKYEI